MSVNGLVLRRSIALLRRPLYSSSKHLSCLLLFFAIAYLLDCLLAAGVNSHFLFGMLSFSYLIGVRSYFSVGTGALGQGVAGIAASTVLYMAYVYDRSFSSS